MAPIKRKIIFVDDEPNVLQGLRRMLRSMRAKWDMTFAEGPQAALEILKSMPHDVIVSDMRMPGMDGAQLLREVKTHYPTMVRIILSGQSEQEKILRAIGPTHRYLSKPCDPDVIKLTIESSCNLRESIQDPILLKVISDTETLPSLPGIYQEIMSAMEDETSSLKSIGTILSRDMAMTAKVLHVANSAFYGQHHHVSSAEQAVALLGVDTMRALVLQAHIFSTFDWEKLQKFSIEKIWNHSITSASFARMIAAEETTDQWVIEDSFASGLLHDIGKLVLATNFPSQYEEVLTLAQTENIEDWEAEKTILNTTHMAIGAHLLDLWGLPDSILEALAFHHHPGTVGHHSFTPLTAVHIADTLDKKGELSTDKSKEGTVDFPYLESLGLTERIHQWSAV